MSLLPPILPDELLLGYLGRIAALNGCTTRRDVALALGVVRQERDAEMDGTGSVLSVVSLLNGLSPDEMLAAHTCHALACSIGARPEATPGRRAHDRANRMAIRNVGKRLRFCPGCVGEDLQQHRFTYWRRRHQVPGRYTCAEHARPLGITRESPLGMSFPEDASHFEFAAEQGTLGLCARNPNIAFALDFLDMTLMRAVVLDRDQCSTVIQRVVRQRGEDPSAPGWHIDFCRRIEAEFPMTWLRLVFPTAKFPGGHLRPYYMSWISQSALSIPHASLAVVASLLFATPEDALEALMVEPKARRVGPRRAALPMM